MKSERELTDAEKLKQLKKEIDHIKINLGKLNDEEALRQVPILGAVKGLYEAMLFELEPKLADGIQIELDAILKEIGEQCQQ